MPVIFGTGSRKPEPTRPPLDPAIWTICSVFPRIAFNSHVGNRIFEMPACPKCEKHEKAPCPDCKLYSRLTITAMYDPEDAPFAADGSGRIIHVIKAEDAAKSLLENGGRDHGVFVVEGDGENVPPSMILKAITDYVIWGEKLVREADELWGLKKDAKLIDPSAHDCARYLGLTREWLATVEAQEACRICGKYAKMGVILGECGHPINWQRAADLGLMDERLYKYGIAEGLIAEREEPKRPDLAPKRGPGRPLP